MADWNIWNNRYIEFECAYGKEPNEFLKTQLGSMQPGSLLLPGEGEGRNALWAAKKGWDVTAFDFSIEAVKKATKLFESEKVDIKYQQGSVDTFTSDKKFDVVALIYLHLPSEVSTPFFQKIKDWLNPKGKVVLECFHPDHLGRFSGGPKDPDLFPSFMDFRIAFNDMKIDLLVKEEVSLNEGPLHQGLSIVTRLIATK